MKRKTVALLLALLVIFSGTASVQAFDQESALGLLSSMNIMNGYPDGSYHLENYVTRAEFTKIAIAASDYRNMVATNMTVSPFPDVQFTHWAAPYIKLGVSNKLITGYSDATFKPNNNVTLEEAATICLRLLGYTNEDFGSSWPYGQMGIANNINLTENISLSVGEPMTRGDVLNMVFNMLNTKSKGANSYYIEKMDYQIVEDTILIATSDEDSAVGSDKILTDSGTYNITNEFDRTQIGKRGDLVLKNGNEAVMFVPSNQRVEEYSIYQTLADDLIVYQNGTMKSLDLESGLAVYYKSNKSSLSSVLQSVASGDVIKLFKNDAGVIDYAMIQTDKMVGPVTVSAAGWQVQLGISNTDGLTILRDGSKATAGDIETYDIAYYSKELSTVWAYSKKVTGIYEKANPNRDSITSVVVSGTTYELETAAAMNALSSTGEYNYGDTVTLLLGKNGGVADVLTSASNNKDIYGYLAATGKKDYTNSDGETYNSYYADIVVSNGTMHQYATKTDYSLLLNKVVRVAFSDGTAELNTQSSGNISGTVSASAAMVGNSKLSADVAVLEVSTTDSNEQSTYKTTFLQRLDGIQISSSNVLYYAKNSRGEICELILLDVTGDLAQYGVVLSAPEASETKTGGTYSLDVNGETKNYSSNATYSVSSTVPVKIVTSGNKLESLTALTRLDESITDINQASLKTKNGNTYQLADGVTAYKKVSNSYMIVPLSEIIDNDNVTISAYYDKKENFGGRIRVIVAKDK